MLARSNGLALQRFDPKIVGSKTGPFFCVVALHKKLYTTFSPSTPPFSAAFKMAAGRRLRQIYHKMRIISLGLIFVQIKALLLGHFWVSLISGRGKGGRGGGLLLEGTVFQNGLGL